jgi:hypothetical protein
MEYREESVLSKMSMVVNTLLVGAGEQVNSANILSDPSKRKSKSHAVETCQVLGLALRAVAPATELG